jgi:hypothetical protein
LNAIWLSPSDCHSAGVEEWITALPFSLWPVICRVTAGKGDTWLVLEAIVYMI